MASTPQPQPRLLAQSHVLAPPNANGEHSAQRTSGQHVAGKLAAPQTAAARLAAARSPLAPHLATIPIEAQAAALGRLITQRQLAREEVQRRTREIGEIVLSHSRVMQTANFTSTTAADLQRMAELYDVQFFDSSLLSLAKQFGMSFRWSSRMTSAGGKTIRSTHRPRGSKKTKVSYEIALSATLLFQTFGDLERPIRVTGHNCTNRMQAMQRILEHELIHLAEMLVWDDSNCAACRFQTIANRFFSHTEHKHDLVTQQERAAKKYNIRVGSMVSFAHEGRSYIGKVNRITRRATILVVDSSGERYDDGKFYRKFYVPLGQLRPV